MKTALILDHYTPSETLPSNNNNIQDQSSQKRTLITRSIEKSYKVSRIAANNNTQHQFQNINLFNSQVKPQQFGLVEQPLDLKDIYQQYQNGGIGIKHQDKKKINHYQIENTTLNPDQMIQDNFHSQLLKRPNQLNDKYRRKAEATNKPQQLSSSNEKLFFSQPRPHQQNQLSNLVQSQSQKQLMLITHLGQNNNSHKINSKHKQQNQYRFQNNQRIEQQQRYFSQDQRPTATMVNTMKLDFNLESIIEDQELLSFQKEIERRFARAETKHYQYPRVNTSHHLEHLALSDDNQEECKIQFFTQDDQTSTVGLSLPQTQQKVAKRPKEKFCDKLKKANPNVQQLQQSYSTQKIPTHTITMFHQEPKHQQKNSQVSHFFENTHKRVNKHNQLELKALVTSPQNNNNNSSNNNFSTANSFMQMYPQTTKAGNERELSQNFEKYASQYFASGINMYNEVQFAREVQAAQQKLEKQGSFKKIDKQKLNQLNQLIKQIGTGTNSFVNLAQQDLNQPSAKKTTSQDYLKSHLHKVNPEILTLSQHSQPQSPKKNILKIKNQIQLLQDNSNHSNVYKSPAKYQLIQKPQIIASSDQSQPHQQKTLQKMLSSQVLQPYKNNQHHQQVNLKPLKQSLIQTSYKKFKEIDEQQSRTSRNQSYNSTHSNIRRSRENSQNKSSKRSDNADINKESINNGIKSPHQHLIQNLSKLTKSSSQRKFKHLTSTLQVTGSQALKKNNNPTTYDVYNSVIQVKAPLLESITPKQQTGFQNPGHGSGGILSPTSLKMVDQNRDIIAINQRGIPINSSSKSTLQIKNR